MSELRERHRIEAEVLDEIKEASNDLEEHPEDWSEVVDELVFLDGRCPKCGVSTGAKIDVPVDSCPKCGWKPKT